MQPCGTWSGGHLNDVDWWWNTSAQGWLGAIIGGLVTVAALYWTLANDRRVRREQAIDDAAAAAFEAVWRAHRDPQATTLRMEAVFAVTLLGTRLKRGEQTATVKQVRAGSAALRVAASSRDFDVLQFVKVANELRTAISELLAK